MNDRQQLEVLSKEITDLNDVADKAQNDTAPIREKKSKILAKIIKDEKLLAQTWEITSTEPSLSLVAVEDWKGFPELCELLNAGYHESYSFLGGYATYLRFEDGEVSLRLEHADALQFIRDHGILVDLSNLIEERDGLVTRLATANALLASVKGLTQ